ncbi:MAG: PIN domain-containing protein [Propionibacteriaceae bacterium]|jgi:PIN domain nuclease of toxin-antitoxin system|nr:PIN domain-containing protein [Propionibacteriaceae bacterium]
MRLLDSSAILATLWGEPGGEESFDQDSCVCTVVNWAEVAGKVLSRQADWTLAQRALFGLGLRIVPMETVDVDRCAQLWFEHPFLSLGDRICLAVGERLGADIITADRQWSDVSSRVILIR